MFCDFNATDGNFSLGAEGRGAGGGEKEIGLLLLLLFNPLWVHPSASAYNRQLCGETHAQHRWTLEDKRSFSRAKDVSLHGLIFSKR